MLAIAAMKIHSVMAGKVEVLRCDVARPQGTVTLNAKAWLHLLTRAAGSLLGEMGRPGRSSSFCHLITALLRATLSAEVLNASSNKPVTNTSQQDSMTPSASPTKAASSKLYLSMTRLASAKALQDQSHISLQRATNCNPHLVR